jgi:hypothetical protein
MACFDNDMRCWWQVIFDRVHQFVKELRSGGPHAPGAPPQKVSFGRGLKESWLMCSSAVLLVARHLSALVTHSRFQGVTACWQQVGTANGAAADLQPAPAVSSVTDVSSGPQAAMGAPAAGRRPAPAAKPKPAAQSKV